MRVEILLKEIRLKKNISLRDLEKRSGISKSHLNAIELQEKEPSISVLVRIAKALDVQIEELLEKQIEEAKKKLDEYVEKYGLQDERTLKQSIIANNLINEYYKKTQ